ncbi:MAG: hypothetical protein H6741_06175 [Alphaproteobacteria bacterium]|nr:hypothetical protein [Alphaproteobacteria bacterium]MCB9792296.1 hypothetical protein [Alphaproteobacteria bacterium]
MRVLLLVLSLSALTACAKESCTASDGTVYAHGESFSEACNTCTCEDGGATCTAMGCPDTGGTEE